MTASCRICGAVTSGQSGEIGSRGDEAEKVWDTMFFNETTNSGYRYQAELVGGPFDGQLVWFTQLPPHLALPVNENMFLKSAGQSSGPPAPASSIAFYGLTNNQGKWQFRFTASRSPKQARMDRWSG